jgi:hypothetical protein
MGAGLALSSVSRLEIIRTALFWIITQRVVVIHHRRFGTTYRFDVGVFVHHHTIQIN